jgi:dephospho-CoA kinase
MSAWSDKFVIGLTGNIATGKSVVRKMLEHLGAYGIDADALAHRAIAQGSPGYRPVVETFGKWILTADGQIDRARLARIVFSDEEALAQLENIVHPLVAQAVDLLVRRSKHKVIVIEAIKLLESSLRSRCDTIWVTTASYDTQLTRLTQKRGVTDATARQRIAAQAPQEEKIAAADVVIHNDRSFDDTWQQVVAVWQKQVPVIEPASEGGTISTPSERKAEGGLVVERGRPRQAEEIAAFINKMNRGQRRLAREDIMEAFGEKAFMLLRVDGRLAGLVGWQVENLVARTSDVHLDPALPPPEALRALLNEVERASRELQCEISLLFIPAELYRHETIWQELGYELRIAASLGVRAWQEAALESASPGSMMLFKQLRKDRVLRPV